MYGISMGRGAAGIYVKNFYVDGRVDNQFAFKRWYIECIMDKFFPFFERGLTFHIKGKKSERVTRLELESYLSGYCKRYPNQRENCDKLLSGLVWD